MRTSVNTTNPILLVRVLGTLTSLTLLLSAPLPTYAATGERKSFVVSRTNSAPIIDGRLDDEAWRDTAIVDDFHQTYPTNGKTPTERTVVHVTYDDEYLYIGAQLYDSDPSAIQAMQLVQGKPLLSDDRFWMMLDSFNSKRNDYFFQVNPNGIRRDALRENNAQFIEEWNTIWYTESAVNGNGWATEIAIPFKSISFTPDSDTWGINFGRGIVRKQEFNVWSSHNRQDWPAYGGEISGLSDMKQGLGLDVVPSINLQRRRDIRLDTSETHFEPSLDVRYRLTPSLTSTFTINTDFSTTEVDERQIALDRFSLFFPEKRDFFLQDAGIFEFGNIEFNGRPFFSRRIGLSGNGETIGIDGGIKLTGRVGDFNLGALAIRQEANGDIEAKDLLVARASRNVFRESAFGVIATHGNPTSNDDNAILGIDLLYRNSNGPFGQILTSTLWAQKSDSTDVDDGDHAFGASVELPNDRVRIRLSAQEIAENFKPALGFVNRTGIRRYDATFRYRTRPETGRWRRIDNRIEYFRVDDMNDRTLSERTRIQPVNIRSHAGDILFVEWERNEELVLNDFALFGRLDVPAGQYSFARYRARVETSVQSNRSI